ncbi:MAG: NfeD family protein [Verrucomicrobiota bacterium]
MELVIALIVVGAILLILETILPGLIAGSIGLLCIIAGVYLAYDRLGVEVGNYVLMGVAVALIVGTICWLKYFPNSRLARPLISRSAVGGIGTDRPELLDQVGTAYTNLRPSGTALLEGKRVDVVTEGALIEKGAAIKVVAIEGLRVIVRAI